MPAMRMTPPLGLLIGVTSTLAWSLCGRQSVERVLSRGGSWLLALGWLLSQRRQHLRDDAREPAFERQRVERQKMPPADQAN